MLIISDDNYIEITKVLCNYITGSQKSPRSRRQRTTSMSQSSKKTSTESILRSKTRTIYTAGRPPWYNSAGQQVEPFVIGQYIIVLIINLIKNCF